MDNLSYTLTVIFLFLLSIKGLSQSPLEYENLKNKYPGENAVIVNDIENITIDVEKNHFKVSEEVIKETLLLKNPVNAFANDYIYISCFTKIKELDARTLLPDGNKYKSKKVESFSEASDQSSGVFNDEIIKKSFVFPALQPGAITSLKYIQENNFPHYSGSFFFKWRLPCEISKLSIKADKRAKIKFKLYNTTSSEINFTQIEKGKYNIYTWEAKNISAAPYENNGPNSRYYYPHIIYYIDNTYPSDTTNTDNLGLNGLYNYYYSLVKDVNLQEDSTIKAEVNQIISGAADENEKVRRIFYWVQDKITYVAFEEGMQGFIPEKASLVYGKKYGDCKGMSSLLHYMLKLAGIKSYLTWIGTCDIPYKYTEAPTERVDNHMIVTYYQNGKPLFLDATNNYLPLGIPSSMIQGKQALVSMGEKKYKIEEVPIIPCTENEVNDSVYIKTEGNQIMGNGYVSLTGYEKIYKTPYLTNKDKLSTKEYLLGLLRKGNNKFFLDTSHIENLANRELPLNINYQFRLNDYIRQIDGEIYLNMNLSKPYANATYDPQKRFISVLNKHNSMFRYKTVFEIPNGYYVANLPANKKSSCKELAFDISYQIKDSKVIQEKTICEDYFLLEPSNFKIWNEVIEILDQAYRDVIILKKKP
jgi:hypothetical protein